jgi:transposase
LVLGRSGTVYSGWLDAPTPAFRHAVKQAALDPFRGYANALRDTLPDTVQVLDALHVVKLGTQALDEVRRRVQQEQLGRRGHRDGPLYRIRGPLRHGVEHLTDRQQARLTRHLAADDQRRGRVCLGQLPATTGGLLRHRPRPAPARRRMAIAILDTFRTCPIPEIACLGRTLQAWCAQVLAYFDTQSDHRVD